MFAKFVATRAALVLLLVAVAVVPGHTSAAVPATVDLVSADFHNNRDNCTGGIESSLRWFVAGQCENRVGSSYYSGTCEESGNALVFRHTQPDCGDDGFDENTCATGATYSCKQVPSDKLVKMRTSSAGCAGPDLDSSGFTVSSFWILNECRSSALSGSTKVTLSEGIITSSSYVEPCCLGDPVETGTYSGALGECFTPPHGIGGTLFLAAVPGAVLEGGPDTYEGEADCLPTLVPSSSPIASLDEATTSPTVSNNTTGEGQPGSGAAVSLNGIIALIGTLFAAICL